MGLQRRENGNLNVGEEPQGSKSASNGDDGNSNPNNNNSSSNSSSNRSNHRKGKRNRLPIRLLASVAVMVSVIALSTVSKNLSVQQITSTSTNTNAPDPSPMAQQHKLPDHCRFRDYANHPKHRLYGMASEQYPEPFLKSSKYIHGLKPILLDVDKRTLPEASHANAHATKLCSEKPIVNPSEYTMDGTNPGIIDLARISMSDADLPSESSPGLSASSSSSSPPIYHSIMTTFPSAKYVVSLTFKDNHQCTYEFNTETKKANWKKPRSGLLPGRQQAQEMDIILMDQHFRALATTTVQMFTSALSTSKVPKALQHLPPQAVINGGFDDGRLFVHDSRLWISYKRYHGGDLNTQYMSPLHLYVETDTLRAEARKELEMRFGRNMAFLQQAPHPLQTAPSPLRVLQWVDPLWVQSLDLASIPLDVFRPLPLSVAEQRIGSAGSQDQQHVSNKLVRPSIKDFTVVDNNFGQKKGVSKRKEIQYKLRNPPFINARSHFHGTSGMLLYIPGWNEHLGIGHFHRERRWANDAIDAQYGHHYTHAFFTINAAANHSEDERRYMLRRISQEFMFPSQHTPNDADIIQFASGLEAIWDDDDTSLPSKLIISYGINDCEAGVVVVDWKVVESLLRVVESQRKMEVRHVLEFVEGWKK